MLYPKSFYYIRDQLDLSLVNDSPKLVVALALEKNHVCTSTT